MSDNGFTGDPYEDAQILVDAPRSFDVTRVDVRAIARELLTHRLRGNEIPEGPFGQSLLAAIEKLRSSDFLSVGFPVLGKAEDDHDVEVTVRLMPRRTREEA